MIVVTGATGHLGRLVIEELLKQRPAREIVAAVRDPRKAADLEARGVEVRLADYDRPETLAPAFAGADRLLLISSSEAGRRLPQHRAAIDAAVQAGVGHLVYTSILHAEASKIALAAEHIATEALIQASGLPYTILRNGWYIENYTENLAPALEHGAILGAAGDGRVAAATRADYAAAAAAVLTGSGHENTVHELAGDAAFTMAELAAEVSRATGKPVIYKDLPPDAYIAALAGAGVPRPFAELLADADLGVARGDLADDSGTLHRLLGRSTTSLRSALEATR
jgi:NAD(P)H dehydrogenase (quinone)